MVAQASTLTRCGTVRQVALEMGIRMHIWIYEFFGGCEVRGKAACMFFFLFLAFFLFRLLCLLLLVLCCICVFVFFVFVLVFQ